MNAGFKIMGTEIRNISESWSPVLGTKKTVVNKCSELKVYLEGNRVTRAAR